MCSVLFVFQFAFVHYFTKFGFGEVYFPPLSDVDSSEEEYEDEVEDLEEYEEEEGEENCSKNNRTTEVN